MYLKQQLNDKLIEHRRYINLNGQDLPEIRNWTWSGSPQAGTKLTDVPPSDGRAGRQ